MSRDHDRTLADIDAAVEAWEQSTDAYRWEPDAEPGMQPSPIEELLDAALAAMERVVFPLMELHRLDREDT